MLFLWINSYFFLRKRWYNKEDYEWRRLEMATLADVAKRANVSKMTVSRVINHPDQVSDELKMLVYSAMEALEYVPNYLC